MNDMNSDDYHELASPQPTQLPQSAIHSAPQPPAPALSDGDLSQDPETDHLKSSHPLDTEKASIEDSCQSDPILNDQSLEPLQQSDLQDSDLSPEFPSPSQSLAGQGTTSLDLNDLPSLTPSKSSTTFSDSESDSIPEGFAEDDEEAVLIESLSLLGSNTQVAGALRTPASNSSLGPTLSQASLSEPGPTRAHRIGRKRSLSELVALRYRGGKGDSEIGDEERGLLALDLGAYVNSGDPDLPSTRPLPPSGLFPTLQNLTPPASTLDGEPVRSRYPRVNVQGLPLPPPRSEWPFGGTGPGKTSRGFIPGRSATRIYHQTDN